jgi:hypothetical protein
MSDDTGPNYHHVAASEIIDDELVWWQPWSNGHDRIGWIGTRPDGSQVGIDITAEGTMSRWTREP